MKKIFLIMGVVVLVLAIAIVIAIIYLSNSDQSTKIREQEPATEMSAFHSKNGYTITYPKNWVAENSRIGAPAEMLSEPSGKAFFAMQTIQDPRVTKPTEMPQVHKDIEEAFKNDPTYLVERMEWEKDDPTIAENSYFVAGLYTKDNTVWRFKELGIFSKSGIILVLRGATLKENAGEFGPILDKIIFSVHPDNETMTSVNERQALFNVKNRPEVVKYVADLKKIGKSAGFEVQENEYEWSIQVFEIVKNDDEPSRTTTFGWYLIDKKNGQLTGDL